MLDTNLLIHLLSFVAVTSLVLWFGSWFMPSFSLGRRLDEFREDSAQLDSLPTGHAIAPGHLVVEGLRKFGGKLLPNSQSERTQLQTRLMHAGLYSPAALPTYLATKLLCMVVPPVVGGACGLLQVVDLPLGLYSGAIAGGVCGILPSWYLDRRKSKRQIVLRRSLPDFLDLLIACVEGGLSLQAAVQRVTDELKVAHPSLTHEMNILQRELGLGSPLPNALRHLGQRTDLEGVRSLATVIQQSQRYGGAVTAALRIQADMLRTQRELRAEELANKAAVKILFPTLLFIFPAIFVVVAAPAAIQIQEKFGKSTSTVKPQARP